jgi:hypothetical protein
MSSGFFRDEAAIATAEPLKTRSENSAHGVSPGAGCSELQARKVRSFLPRTRLRRPACDRTSIESACLLKISPNPSHQES